jgi:plastocyanin
VREVATPGRNYKMRFWQAQRAVGKFFRTRIAPAAVAGMLTGTAIGATPLVISQMDREFKPNNVKIKRGETLQFVNDDGDLRHHAYLKTASFSFDSGDQVPGSKFDVVFTTPGEFNVRCAIHPKMKLVVVVE